MRPARNDCVSGPLATRPLADGMAALPMARAQLRRLEVRVRRRLRPVWSRLIAVGLAVAVLSLALVVARPSAGRSPARPGEGTGSVATPVIDGAIVVQPGDTLWSIGRAIRAPREDTRLVVLRLMELNGLHTARLMPGQTLRLR